MTPAVHIPAILAFGDPTIAGWTIVVFYLAGAAACVWALRVAWMGSRMAADYPGDRRARDRSAAYKASFLFWALLIALFLFLGLNKQIDLQSWLADVGRDMAKAQGWYEQRGRVQTIFVGAVAVSGLWVLAFLLDRTRDLLPRHALAFGGLVLLACFVILRTSSFHDVDRVLGWGVGGMKLSWVLELLGITCVGLCAVMNCLWYKPRPAGGEAQSTAAA
ncbi:MAG: hypothetical protein ACYTGE_14200 [Planctomycetota bacterium]|jgi:hypothetical protein